MIFLHLLLGLLLGKLFGYTFLFVVASIAPDIDHLCLIVKYRLFTKKRFLDALKHEEHYHIRFKTPLMHSLFGLFLCSLIFYFIVPKAQLTLFFSLTYLSHLLLDWPDIDKKQFLYPWKKEFSGFLPIWSKAEKAVTLLALIILAILYAL